jgi:hypothetical protein
VFAAALGKERKDEVAAVAPILAESVSRSRITKYGVWVNCFWGLHDDGAQRTYASGILRSVRRAIVCSVEGGFGERGDSPRKATLRCFGSFSRIRL